LVTLVETTVPEGSWVVVATVTGLKGPEVFAGSAQQFGFQCQLQDANNQFMGGASVVGGSSPDVQDVHALAFTGGTFAPAGQTQTIRLKCSIGLPGQTDVEGAFDGGQILVFEVGGFF